jgi:hypothetical protein
VGVKFKKKTLFIYNIFVFFVLYFRGNIWVAMRSMHQRGAERRNTTVRPPVISNSRKLKQRLFPKPRHNRD